MRYLGIRASVIKVQIRPGYWASSRQAKYLAERLVIMMDGRQDRVIYYKDAEGNKKALGELPDVISRFLQGYNEEDVALRTELTPAEYQILSGVADFIAGDPTGVAGDGRSYVACNLNTGYNLVLVPR